MGEISLCAEKTKQNKYCKMYADGLLFDVWNSGMRTDSYVQFLSVKVWCLNALTCLSWHFNSLHVDVSKHCWMSGKQCRPWSDAAHNSMWSGATVCSGLSKYLGYLVFFTETWNRPFIGLTMHLSEDPHIITDSWIIIHKYNPTLGINALDSQYHVNICVWNVYGIAKISR